jgi:hypothetical protein
MGCRGTDSLSFIPNNRESFVGAIEFTAINLDIVPFADGANPPIKGEAYIDQTAQFLVASS